MIPAMLVPRARTHGARERGNIENVGGFFFARQIQAVRENQTAFGVGVVDHDGLAVLRIEDVAGKLGVGVGRVFGGGDDSGDIEFRLQLADSLHGIEHGGAAGHVALHLPHFVGRFDRDAARVERDAFADKSQVKLRLLRPVSQADHPRRMAAAAADLDESVVAFFREPFFIPDLQLEVGFLGDFACGFGHAFGNDGGARLIDEVAGFVDGFGDERIAVEIALVGDVGFAHGGEMDAQLSNGRSFPFDICRTCSLPGWRPRPLCR